MTAKRFLYVVLTALFVTCCTDDAKVDELQKQIDGIKASEIAGISAQLEAIQASLPLLRQVDAEVKAYIGNQNPDALTAADQALVQTIADLQSYSTQVTDSLDWLATTIITMEKHRAVLLDLATIKLCVGEAGGSAAKAKVLAAVAAAEASVKGWVDEEIEGYYTIAQADAKLKALEDALRDADESLSGDINKLRSSLDSAGTALTAAYQAAIAEAITSNNGVVDQKIAADIQAATEALQLQIDALSSRIDSLEARIAALEQSVSKLLGCVRSIAVIPEYTDGSVNISDADSNLIRFEVQPLEAASELAKQGTSAFSLDYVETLTKSSLFTNIPVTAVSFDGELLSVVADGTGLPSAVKTGDRHASARLRISDGTVTRSSGYFYLRYKDSPVSVDLIPLGEITDMNVTLSAKVSMSWNATDEVFAGFVYSGQDSDLIIGESSGIDTLNTCTISPEGVFSCTTPALQASKTYYYRPFVSKNEAVTYGEKASFVLAVCNAPQPSVTVNTQLVNFSWTTEPDDKYRLEIYISSISASYEPDPDDLYSAVELSAGEIPYVKFFPVKSGRYYYRVRTVDSLGERRASAWVYGNFKVDTAASWPNSSDAFDYGVAANSPKTASLDPDYIYDQLDIDIGESFTATMIVDNVSWLSSSSNRGTYKGDRVSYNRKKATATLTGGAQVSSDNGFRFKINRPGTLRFSFKLAKTSDVWTGYEQKFVVVLERPLQGGSVAGVIYDARPGNVSATASEITVTITPEMLCGITSSATLYLWHELDNTASNNLQLDYYPPRWTPSL